MSAQVHPHGPIGKEGQNVTQKTDEESPEARQSTEQLSGLNADQIELKASKQTRMICAGIMLAFAFIDLLGSVLFMPGLGALCQRAEGGPSASMGNALLLPSGALETEDMKGLVPAELVLLHKELDAPIPCSGAALQIDADMVYPVAPWGMCTTAAGEAAPSKADGCTSTWTADPGQPCLLREVHTPASAAHLAWSRIGNPRAFEKVPFRFSTAMNFLLVAEGVFTGLGGMLWGRLADMNMPIKILSQINIVGVLSAYVVMFLAGVHWNSFWGFAAGYALNGLFTGVGVLAPLYIRKAFPPEEGQVWHAALVLNSMVGLGVGTLILMPFISGRGENVFNAAWVGIAGSSVVLVLITRFLVEPKQTAKEEKIDESRAAEKQLPECFASFCHWHGDGGFGADDARAGHRWPAEHSRFGHRCDCCNAGHCSCLDLCVHGRRHGISDETPSLPLLLHLSLSPIPPSLVISLARSRTSLLLTFSLRCSDRSLPGSCCSF